MSRRAAKKAKRPPEAAPSSGGGLLAGSAMLVLLVSITFNRRLSDDFWFIDDSINFRHGGYALERCSEWAWVWTHKPLIGMWEPAAVFVKKLVLCAFGFRAAPLQVLSVCMHASVAVLAYHGLACSSDGENWRHSALAATALWACHPLRVEVVCWLSAQSWILALLGSVVWLRGGALSSPLGLLVAVFSKSPATLVPPAVAAVAALHAAADRPPGERWLRAVTRSIAGYSPSLVVAALAAYQHARLFMVSNSNLRGTTLLEVGWTLAEYAARQLRGGGELATRYIVVEGTNPPREASLLAISAVLACTVLAVLLTWNVLAGVRVRTSLERADPRWFALAGCVYVGLLLPSLVRHARSLPDQPVWQLGSDRYVHDIYMHMYITGAFLTSQCGNWAPTGTSPPMHA